uniref:Transmembrane protein n=1 Tax=Glossina palpalis gambiensis TaxID=67801 RepID=A0A1B0BGA3_9MUSC
MYMVNTTQKPNVDLLHLLSYYYGWVIIVDVVVGVDVALRWGFFFSFFSTNHSVDEWSTLLYLASGGENNDTCNARANKC